MKVLVKKVIAVLACTSLFFQTTLSASFFDGILGDGNLMNVTPAGVYQIKNADGSPSDITLYTGGVFFKFGSAFELPPPIFNISPPKMSAGCGGLSIKGMFVNLLGLDRLEVMLKNAGASLAWGIAVGLIYSLPGIGKAFEFINSWAKKIQQLLANACASGMAIGQSIGRTINANAESGVKNLIANVTVQAGSDVANKLDNFQNSIESGLGFLKDYFDSDMVFSGLNEHAKKHSPDEVQANWSTFISSSLVERSFSNDFLMTLIEKMPPETRQDFILKNVFGVTAVSEIKNFDLKKIAVVYDDNGQGTTAGDFKIIGVNTLTDLVMKNPSVVAGDLSYKARLAQASFGIALMKYLGSDVIANDSNSIEDLTKNIQNIDKALDTSVANKARNNATGKIFGLDAKNDASPEIIQTMIQGFLFGSESKSYKDAKKNVKDRFGTTLASIPALGYAVIPMASSINGPADQNRIFVIFALKRATTEKLIPFLDDSISKEGLIERSKKLIEKMISGITTKTTTDALGNVTTTEVKVSEIEKEFNVSLIVPQLYNYVKIMQQSQIYDRQDALDRLAKFNAYQILDGLMSGYLYTQSFASSMIPVVAFEQGIFKVQGNKTGISASTGVDFAESMKITQKAMEQVQIKYAEWRKSQWGTEEQQVIDFFKELNRKNLDRAVKAAPENAAQ